MLYHRAAPGILQQQQQVKEPPHQHSSKFSCGVNEHFPSNSPCLQRPYVCGRRLACAPVCAKKGKQANVKVRRRAVAAVAGACPGPVLADTKYLPVTSNWLPPCRSTSVARSRPGQGQAGSHHQRKWQQHNQRSSRSSRTGSRSRQHQRQPAARSQQHHRSSSRSRRPRRSREAAS